MSRLGLVFEEILWNLDTKSKPPEHDDPNCVLRSYIAYLIEAVI